MKSKRLASAISDNLQYYKPVVKEGESYSLVEVKLANVVYDKLKQEAKSKGITINKLLEDYVIAGFVIS